MYSQAQLNKIARQLNERPRETLKYETPAEDLTPVLRRPVEPEPKADMARLSSSLFADDFATSRAGSMKSCATGLGGPPRLGGDVTGVSFVPTLACKVEDAAAPSWGTHRAMIARSIVSGTKPAIPIESPQVHLCV